MHGTVSAPHHAWLSSTPATYTCSEACRRTHVACLGCGVLSGPDHSHLLRDGFCCQMLTTGEAPGTVAIVPLFNSCWSQARAGALPTPLGRTA